MIYLKKGEKPTKVKVSGSRQIKDWQYLETKKQLIITLGAPMGRLKGKVYDHKNKPLRVVKVQIAGVGTTTYTDSGGSFEMKLPPNLTINQNSTITINDSIKIPSQNLKIRDSGLYVIINVPNKVSDESEVTLIN